MEDISRLFRHDNHKDIEKLFEKDVREKNRSLGEFMVKQVSGVMLERSSIPAIYKMAEPRKGGNTNKAERWKCGICMRRSCRMTNF